MPTARSSLLPAAFAALVNATVWGLAWIPLKWLEAHGVGTLWTTLFIFTACTLAVLAALSRRYPNTRTALTAIGQLTAILRLPKDSVHVVSDVHGEHKKLRHILNNASGSLRPLVDELFGDRLSEAERRDLLALVYYPSEAYAKAAPPTLEARQAFVLRALALERFDIALGAGLGRLKGRAFRIGHQHACPDRLAGERPGRGVPA